MFWCISYYFGAFVTICCLKKLEAKRAKLVQKFVSRSHFGIFRNERTRSTPLDTKLMFWHISYYFDAFGIFAWLAKLDGKRAELMPKFVPRSHVRIFRNERTRSTHWTQNWRFGAFLTIWVHSGPFCCLTILGAKRAELVLSCHEVASKFFAMNAPDRLHWTLNSCFVAFRTI